MSFPIGGGIMRTLAPADFASVPIDEDDAEERLARSRERNREHARRTRLRKKAQLQALQSRVKELQAESRLLKQKVEESSIASILLGLSSGNHDGSDNVTDVSQVRSDVDSIDLFTAVGKRKRFLSLDGVDPSPQPMKLNIKGQTTLVGGGSGNGKTHINWKSGVYCDENGVQKQLTPDELETLRRERNRMHAKMTRDRKKIFISSVERTISQLESENRKMREILEKRSQNHSASMSPGESPAIRATVAPVPSVTPMLQPVETPLSIEIPEVSLATHGRALATPSPVDHTPRKGLSELP